jgi:hypothetical protein
VSVWICAYQNQWQKDCTVWTGFSVQCLLHHAIWRNALPPSSGSKVRQARMPVKLILRNTGKHQGIASQNTVLFGVLAADSQSTSQSWYWASLWDPWPDFILLFLFRPTITFFFFRRRDETRKRVCSLLCNHSLVRSLMPNNHTLPSHLRLCSLSVASYGSRGLRWKYCNPPPYRVQYSSLLLSVFKREALDWDGTGFRPLKNTVEWNHWLL